MIDPIIHDPHHSKEILKNRLLFQFLSNDYTDDDMLNYLCEVDISKDDYKIKVFNFDKADIHHPYKLKVI